MADSAPLNCTKPVNTGDAANGISSAHPDIGVNGLQKPQDNSSVEFSDLSKISLPLSDIKPHHAWGSHPLQLYPPPSDLSKSGIVLLLYYTDNRFRLDPQNLDSAISCKANVFLATVTNYHPTPVTQVSLRFGMDKVNCVHCCTHVST
ncbi:unnamed protein product [Protopolystoma xenopodis]|uniref:Uncharacterized protein n=1 Tax=Protopolystoma xenopodis TaxID=117903 RepID=A0A448XC86_9PLAT|nr:unnamed protein product [Protopolystoma xenopodis]